MLIRQSDSSHPILVDTFKKQKALRSPLRSGKSSLLVICFLKLRGLLGDSREPRRVRLLGRDILTCHVSSSPPPHTCHPWSPRLTIFTCH